MSRFNISPGQTSTDAAMDRIRRDAGGEMVYEDSFFATPIAENTRDTHEAKDQDLPPLSRKTKAALMAAGLLGTVVAFVGLNVLADEDQSRLTAIEECVFDRTGEEIELTLDPGRGTYSVPSEHSSAITACETAINQGG